MLMLIYYKKGSGYMKFKVLSIILGSFLFLALGFNQEEVSANGLTESLNEGIVIDYDNLQITELDGSIILFDNKEDMEIHLNNSEEVQKDTIGIYALGETVVGTQYKSYQFLGYSKFTPSWTKASRYTLTNNQTESFSSKVTTDWGDVSVSFSKSYGVNTSIPADSSRFSKLAGYADLKIERIKVSQPNLSSSYYKTKVTKTNTYVAVRYQ